MPTSFIASTTGRMNAVGGLRAGGLGPQSVRCIALEERLRHLRAPRVLGADEQHVLHLGYPPSLCGGRHSFSANSPGRPAAATSRATASAS